MVWLFQLRDYHATCERSQAYLWTTRWPDSVSIISCSVHDYQTLAERQCSVNSLQVRHATVVMPHCMTSRPRLCHRCLECFDGAGTSLVHPLIFSPLSAHGGKCEHLHAEVGSFMRSGCSGASVLLHCPDTRPAAESFLGCAVTQSRAAAPGLSPLHAVARGRPPRAVSCHSPRMAPIPIGCQCQAGKRILTIIRTACQSHFST